MDFIAETVLDGDTGSFGENAGFVYDSDTLVDGRAIVLFDSDEFTGGLAAQFIDADGALIGEPFGIGPGDGIVEQYNDKYWNVHVAALEGGGFAVVWMRLNDARNNHEVYYRIYDKDGNAATDETFFAAGYASSMDISATADGGFVVAWEDDGILIQRFDEDGEKVGAEALLAEDDTITKIGIATLAGGDIAVAWTGQDGPYVANIYTAVLDEELDVVTEPAAAIETSLYPQYEADITALTGGGYAITWSGRPPDGGDTNVWAMVFDETGAATSDSIAMPGSNPGSRNSIVSLGDGGFMVVWKAQYSFGAILGQRFDADGNTVNAALRLDDFSDWTYFPQSLVTGDGTVVGFWNNNTEETIGYQLISFSAYADGTDANEAFTGGSMADYLLGGGGDDTIRAGDDDDTLQGGDGADQLYGEGDNDLISGGSGADTLDGGSGNDRLSGGVGNDALLGGGANDRLYGDAGADLLSGDGGNDVLYGDVGNDTLDGGAGNDTANYFASAAAVTLDLATGGTSGQAKGDTYVSIEHVTGSKRSDDITGDGGDNRLKGMDGWDTLSGGNGDDTLEGGGGNDVLSGGNGADVLSGGGRSDDLSGGAGDDTLTGGTGFDTLTGGAGDDMLTGGAHADVFVFASGSGDDTISDFDADIDMLDLSGAATGFTDLDSVLAAATETADGLLIDLGGGDSVLLAGIVAENLTEMTIIF